MKKKKILFLGDDFRLNSGIGTMSKSIITGTVDRYDWVQIGGAMNHPEAGKQLDLSQAVADDTGVLDASVKIYPVSGYGTPDLIRHILATEEIDAILHFTDPRFWGWLYQMEHEIRQHIPIMYYNIWDDLPYPHWNENAYESCDLLMAISKQTYNINKHVCQRKPRLDGLDLTYVPHGIDENVFFPIVNDAKYEAFKKTATSGKDYDFIALLNSRNIRRKSISDLIVGFKAMCDKLTPEESSKCALLLHTDPVDENGTDLPAVVAALCPEYDVIFSAEKLPNIAMNYLYNMADVVCNPSSAEGFGLSHMEAIMSGTPTIASVLGGLQDQMGFRNNRGEYITIDDFTVDTPSNSTGKISEDHGSWTYPLWPQINLQGSPPTPYIYDSRVSIDQITSGLMYWHNMPKSNRSDHGAIGRDWAIENGFNAKGMTDTMSKSIDTCISTFKPRQRYTLIDASIKKQQYPSGALV